MSLLFNEKVAAVARIRHGMDIQHNITEYLNTGLLAVVAVDQPFFAVVKYTQWQWLEIYDDNQIIVMFGGLHLNKALWKTKNDFLDQSDWAVLLKVNPTY